MGQLPIALLVALGILLVLSRPYLEARRPALSLALALGAALGPEGAGAVPPAALGGLDPVMALAAGWLALLAAEPWDLGTLRRTCGWRRAISFGILLALMLAVMALAGPLLGPFDLDAAALIAPLALVAFTGLAVDPESVREGLARAERPDAAARLAPTIAGLALGGALVGSAVASGLALSAERNGSALTWLAPRHAVLTLLLGAAVGLFFVGPLRLAEGKGSLLALLAAMPLLGWGLARWLDMSGLAVTFAAGAVLANEGTKRDLIFALLRELQLPSTLALLILAGAALPSLREPSSAAIGAVLLVLFMAGRWTAWRIARGAGLRARDALALSPLALPLALGALDWRGPTSGVPIAAGLGFVLCEMLWLLSHRPRRA